MFTFVSSSPVVSRAAFASRAAVLCFAAPKRGAAERRGGSLAFPSRLRGATPASRATGGRLTALHVAIFGCATDASSSGSAHRNRRRDFAPGQALTPDRSGPHLPRPRFAPGPWDATPRCALRAPPVAPRTSEVMRNVAMIRDVVK
jgi:hypothetical protein